LLDARRIISHGSGAISLGLAQRGDERFDFLTRRLRKFCLQYGAALAYTSAVGPRGTNVEELQDYIFHRLYHIPLIYPAKVVGSNEDFSIYIPSGHDNEDLIQSYRVPSKQGWNDDTPYEEVFKNPAKKRKERLKGDTKITEAQPNDEFFKSLMEQLEKGPPVRGDATARPDRITNKRMLLDNLPATLPITVPVPAKEPASAKKAAGASGSGSKKADPKNNIAVKQFFRSLLTSQKGASADSRGTRAKAQKVLKGMKSESGEPTSPTVDQEEKENSGTPAPSAGTSGVEDASKTVPSANLSSSNTTKTTNPPSTSGS